MLVQQLSSRKSKMKRVVHVAPKVFFQRFPHILILMGLVAPGESGARHIEAGDRYLRCEGTVLTDPGSATLISRSAAP
jgi:hypothetical protein